MKLDHLVVIWPDSNYNLLRTLVGLNRRVRNERRVSKVVMWGSLGWLLHCMTDSWWAWDEKTLCNTCAQLVAEFKNF